MSVREMVRRLKLPILGISLEIGGLTTVTVIASIYSNIYSLTENSWSNFPWGILTAMITPDTDTFLYLLERVPLWWFTVFFNVFIMAIFAGFWAFTNYGTNEGQTRTRSRLFFVLLFLPSIISNVVRLIENAKPNIGPPGVEYSLVGIVAGFSLVNGLPAFRGGVGKNLELKKGVTLVSLIEFGVGILILALSFIEPDAFFSVFYEGLHVDYYTHIWAFYSTIGVLAIWGVWKKPDLPLGFAE